MSLFPIHPNEPIEILRKNGTALYYGPILSALEADSLFHSLLHSIAWKNDVVNMFGKKIITKRKVAWYGDDAYNYTYANATKTSLPWTSELLLIKNTVEELTGLSYNACLLNLYHSGAEGLGWHSDDEKDMVKNGGIASLSLGAERKFVFKHKGTQEKVEIILEHGSLLLMKGEIQQYWLHRLPPTKKIHLPRINLTFRTMVIN